MKLPIHAAEALNYMQRVDNEHAMGFRSGTLDCPYQSAFRFFVRHGIAEVIRPTYHSPKIAWIRLTHVGRRLRLD